MDWLGGIEAHWVWLTLGVLLAGLEMVVPGVYLIWLGIAAIAVGYWKPTASISSANPSSTLQSARQSGVFCCGGVCAASVLKARMTLASATSNPDDELMRTVP